MADRQPPMRKGSDNPVMTSNPVLPSTENDVTDSYAQQELEKEAEYSPTYEVTKMTPKEPGQVAKYLYICSNHIILSVSHSISLSCK